MIEKLEQTELSESRALGCSTQSVHLEGPRHKGKAEQAFSRETKPRPKGVKCLPRRHQVLTQKTPNDLKSLRALKDKGHGMYC